MVKITEKDRFISILNREEVDRISIACPLQTGTVEMMEATNVFWRENLSAVSAINPLDITSPFMVFEDVGAVIAPVV